MSFISCVHCGNLMHLNFGGNNPDEIDPSEYSKYCACQFEINPEWKKQGDELKQLRRKSNKSFHDCAKYLGLKTSGISSIERGSSNIPTRGLRRRYKDFLQNGRSGDIDPEVKRIQEIAGY